MYVFMSDVICEVVAIQSCLPQKIRISIIVLSYIMHCTIVIDKLRYEELHFRLLFDTIMGVHSRIRILVFCFSNVCAV